jgi:N-acetylneuraminic acid mutarotase
MIVWGGNDRTALSNAGSDLSDGGIYRPADDRWIAIEGPTHSRNFATAVWTGEEILVWGGTSSSVPQSSTLALSGGYRLNPRTGRIRSVSAVNAPTPRGGACTVWTGAQLLVWGGYEATVDSRDRQRAGTGSRYDPSRDQWSSINTDGAPSIRGQASAVWTGTEMIVWGGGSLNGGTGIFNTGGRYSPANNQWRPMSAILGVLPLSPRMGHCAVWTGREMIVWGGGTNALRYLPEVDAWSAISLKDAPSPTIASYSPGPQRHLDRLRHAGLGWKMGTLRSFQRYVARDSANRARLDCESPDDLGPAPKSSLGTAPLPARIAMIPLPTNGAE